jgi:peptidoglycan/LPS O-acetylase OafA/YrhL
MRAGRTLLLDAVRGLAVAAVVAYHCFTLAVVGPRPDGAVGPGWWLLGAGSLGVDLFFVVAAGLVVLVAVSGALAALSYRWVERPFLARKPAPVPAPVPVRLRTGAEWVDARPAAVGAGPVTPLGR